MLRMLGRRAALLDGGLQHWPGRTERGPARTPRRGRFTATPWPPGRFASSDETSAAAACGSEVVLDARAAGRFTGEVVVVDPRPGHIPGARSVPWEELIADGHFRPAAELAELYTRAGAVPDGATIVYCGSGVTACMNVLGMERAGMALPRLYVAGWSGWSSDPDRPAEQGTA
jgi:thiosulfate/3-mercaptopyruvate sulfurtransferase